MDLFTAVERVVRLIVGDTRYFCQHPCAVQGQSEQTLDLLPDDPELAGPGGLQGVPIRHGLPGVEVAVKSGARVLLGFEGGDPRKPYASLWATDEAALLITLPGDKRPVARKGDPVIVFINPAVPIPMSGTVGGAPFVGTIQITTPVNGMIQEGNPKVLA